MVGCISRSGGILQVIRRIVPASYYVDMGAVGDSRFASIKHIAVVGMATIFQVWIKPGSLLAHILQGEIGRTAVYVVSDLKDARHRLSYPYKIRSRLLVSRNIQPIGLFKGAISAKWLSGRSFGDDFLRTGIDQLPFRALDITLAAPDGDFRGFWEVAEEVGADPGFVALSIDLQSRG